MSIDRGKRAEDAYARRLERQLETAQAITHIGSWEWDVATNVVTWSDELYRIYGLVPRSREITLEFFLGCVHPDDRAHVDASVRDAIVCGGRFGHHERIVRPDGSIRELETLGEAVLGENGTTTGLIGTCRDVTDERLRDETIRVYADIVRHMQIGLAVWDVPDPERIEQVRLIAFNPAAEAVARMPLGPAVGKAFPEIAPYAHGGEFERLLKEVRRSGEVREGTVLRSRDARDPTRAMSIKAFPLPGHRVGVAVEDITAATVAQRFRDAEQHVLEKIASSAPLVDVLETLLRAIEEHSPGTIASILFLEGDHVRHGAAPSLPPKFVAAVDGQPIGPSAGSCGTAAYRRSAVYVEDIEVDPLWENYRSLAREHGLRACWSTPVLARDGRVLGTFALYYRAPRKPGPADLRLIERATQLAGIAIERRQLEDELRAFSAYVESVREEERTAIAREIHDELGQALTALNMDLSWLGRRIGEGGEQPREAIEERLAGMSAMIHGLIEQVQRISAELRPGVLDDLGLVAAIEWQAHEFEKRTGKTCVVRADVDDAGLDRSLTTGVFRIFQEALTNVARHADAEHVEVELGRAEGSLRLDVRDDGRGITQEVAMAKTALGLLGIRERARQLGGSATIRGTIGKGTVLTLLVPLRGAA